MRATPETKLETKAVVRARMQRRERVFLALSRLSRDNSEDQYDAFYYALEVRPELVAVAEQLSDAVCEFEATREEAHAS